MLSPALLARRGVVRLCRVFGSDAVNPGITDRQSQIIELLTGQSRPVSVPEVARRLGCSERTVHRDVEALRRIAVEITTEPGRSGGLLLKRPVASSADAGQPDTSATPRPAAARLPGDEFVGRVVRTINTEDWDAYVGNCNPTRPVMSATQAEFMGENIFTTRVELAGLNYRNVTVRLFDDGTAITTGDEYSFEEPTVEVVYSWVKVDGQWYFSSNCNTAGT